MNFHQHWYDGSLGDFFFVLLAADIFGVQGTEDYFEAYNFSLMLARGASFSK